MKKTLIKLVITATTLWLFALSATAADINMTFRFNDPETKEMRAALDEFESENPGVKVELESIAWSEARAQFLREAATGGGPDVVHIAFVWPHDMGDAEALYPLDDFIENMPIQGGYDDFVATELAVASNGMRYGVPWTTDTWAMMYRTDVLEAAGITKLPETWEELRDASRTIHEKTGKTGFGFPAGSGSNNTIWFFSNYYYWSNNLALVVEDGNGGYKTGIDTDKIVETMKYFHSFIQEGHAPESLLAVNDWFDPAVIEPMVNGDQGFMIFPPANAKAIIASYRERNPGKEPPFVTSTLPGGPAGPKTHLGGRMLGIGANTENPEMAWKLIEFLTREKSLATYYPNQLPAQYSILKTIDLGEQLSGFPAQMEHARTWGAYADGPASIATMWNATGRAFGSAFIGELSYEEAAQKLLDSVEEQLK